MIAPKGIGNKKESKAQDPLGWQAEVTLDVEAVHAMAPGAEIVLVVAPNNYASLDEAVNWVTLHHLADIVTSSWGLPLDLASPGQGTRDSRIFEIAAAEGIEENFSTGDNGDEEARIGYRSVDFPASSPWVNAVDGTSLFAGAGGSYDTETGWGTTFYRLATCASSSPVSPGSQQKHCDTYDQAPSKVLDEGFLGGAGGGLSHFYGGQPWQTSAIGGDTAAGFGTVGTHRAVPDISMLADPYTGMSVWITDLAAGGHRADRGAVRRHQPRLAALRRHHGRCRPGPRGPRSRPAGLASQYVYDLPAEAVRDVLPPSFGNPDMSAAGRPDSRSLFYGSFYSGGFVDVGFNADTSLDTAAGWDDVTGVGTPYAPAFVSALQYCRSRTGRQAKGGCSGTRPSSYLLRVSRRCSTTGSPSRERPAARRRGGRCRSASTWPSSSWSSSAACGSGRSGPGRPATRRTSRCAGAWASSRAGAASPASTPRGRRRSRCSGGPGARRPRRRRGRSRS